MDLTQKLVVRNSIETSVYPSVSCFDRFFVEKLLWPGSWRMGVQFETPQSDSLGKTNWSSFFLRSPVKGNFLQEFLRLSQPVGSGIIPPPEGRLEKEPQTLLLSLPLVTFGVSLRHRSPSWDWGIRWTGPFEQVSFWDTCPCRSRVKVNTLFIDL